MYCEEVEYRSEQDYDWNNDDNASYDAVDKYYAVFLKDVLYFVYQPCQTIPPQYCASYDAEIAYAHLQRVIGDDERQLCENCHEEQYN